MTNIPEENELRRPLLPGLHPFRYPQLSHPRASLSDPNFWFFLVNRLGFDAAVYQSGAIPSLDVISRYFDSTPLGLLRVFHLLDKGAESALSRKEMEVGLVQQGLYCKIKDEDGRRAFDDLLKSLCESLGTGNASIPVPAFFSALRKLRIAAVFSGRRLDNLQIHRHEWSEDALQASCPIEDPVRFFFTEITRNFRVNWIHTHDPSREEILGLSMQHALDPRFVLDVFTLWREYAKADTSDPEFEKVCEMEGRVHTERPEAQRPLSPPLWHFFVIPALRLSVASRESLRPYQTWRREKLRKALGPKSEPPPLIVSVEHCNLAVFVSGSPLPGHVLSFTSEWLELVKTGSTTQQTPGHAPSLIAELPETPRYGGLSVPADLSLFSKLLGQVRTTFSRLRTGDAHTLLFRTLCDVTEDYLLVTQAFDAVMSVLQKRLDKQKDKLDHKDVKRLQKAAIQLSSLFRLVRPVTGVLDALQGRQWSPDGALYLSDIRSNVHRFLDDSVALRETSKVLVERFHQYSNSKTSSVLYALTLVTTVFVPGQFITGLYGMNFQDPITGKPGMPELMWRHGYLIFWIFTILITALTFVYYRQQQWI